MLLRTVLERNPANKTGHVCLAQFVTPAQVKSILSPKVQDELQPDVLRRAEGPCLTVM